MEKDTIQTSDMYIGGSGCPPIRDAVSKAKIRPPSIPSPRSPTAAGRRQMRRSLRPMKRFRPGQKPRPSSERSSSSRPVTAMTARREELATVLTMENGKALAERAG